MITKPIQLPKTDEGKPSAIALVEQHRSTSSRQSKNGELVLTGAWLGDDGKPIGVQWRLGMN